MISPNHTQRRWLPSNPFATRYTRPGALDFIFPEGYDTLRLLQRLARHRWRGQIVGPHGSGKSTLLATLRQGLKLHASQVEVIPITAVRLGPLVRSLWTTRRQRGVVILDGFERLPRMVQSSLIRLARGLDAGLVVTCHREVALPLLWQTRIDDDLARQIVDVLTQQDLAARRCAHRGLQRCFRQHTGDMRETLFDLYDLETDRRRSPSV